MKINITKIGYGKPAISVVGCLHGDEIIGKKVIDELKKVDLLKGSLKLIVANEKALQKKQRMVAKDLNRSFPGKKNGTYEEQLAHSISKEIKNSDIVIDIHATTSNFDRIVIVTNLQKTTRNLLSLVPCKKVALIRKNVFGGGEMIRSVKVGLAIEYGPNKKGANYKKALLEIMAILKNLGMVKGTKLLYGKKELYNVGGSYKVPLHFKTNKNIKNFKLVKKGAVIGWSAGKEIRSSKNFFPIFVGEESYKGILAITASKSKLNLS